MDMASSSARLASASSNSVAPSAASKRSAGQRLPRVPGPYHLLDRALIKRIATTVSEKRITLPALCGCGHSPTPLDLYYPYKCCNNCPLHNKPAAFEQLLMVTLECQGIVPQ